MATATAAAPPALPTHLDLPEADGKPVDNAFQPAQTMLLTGSLGPVLDRFHPDNNYFIGADTGIYWRVAADPLEGCKAPDWYYVPSVPRTLDGAYRRSYVLWQEYARPLLVVEFVSGDGSEERDATPRAGKFWVYERAIQATYYAIHDPERRTLEVLELVRGRYAPVPPTPAGRFPIPALEIELGVWDGEYQGYEAAWLRAWDPDGNLIPTAEDRTAAERERADAERQRATVSQHLADIERQRADRLAAKLRELGLDPDAV